MYTMRTRDSTPPTQKCTGYPVPAPGYPLQKNNPKSNREEDIEEGEASYPGARVPAVNILVNHARSLLYELYL